MINDFLTREDLVFFSSGSRLTMGSVLLASENPGGRPRLVSVIKNEKQVYDFPKLAEIHNYYQSQFKKFDPKLLSVSRKVKYRVEISAGLKRKIKQVKLNLAKVKHDETN